eukprot:GHVU01179102.1.p1 GENE.GHVU01179102.1~~GHVU01179102.1.p1  ORF type:complete len:303 (-),score=12.23 GHVU01179102.1:376-1284(-)
MATCLPCLVDARADPLNEWQSCTSSLATLCSRAPHTAVLLRLLSLSLCCVISQVSEGPKAMSKRDARLSGLLPDISEKRVRQLVRAAMAESCQLASQAMQAADMYSISIDGVGKRGLSVQNLRVRIPGGAEDSYILLAAHLPRSDAYSITKFIISVLSAFDPEWETKLLAITTDGCTTNTGRLTGVVARLEAHLGRKLIVVWCGAHQNDLVLGEVVEALHFDEGTDESIGHWVTVFQALFDAGADFDTRCPFLKDVRWCVRERRLCISLCLRASQYMCLMSYQVVPFRSSGDLPKMKPSRLH